MKIMKNNMIIKFNEFILENNNEKTEYIDFKKS